MRKSWQGGKEMSTRGNKVNKCVEKQEPLFGLFRIIQYNVTEVQNIERMRLEQDKGTL